jgi:hypothetical protein
VRTRRYASSTKPINDQQRASDAIHFAGDGDWEVVVERVQAYIVVGSDGHDDDKDTSFHRRRPLIAHRLLRDVVV